MLRRAASMASRSGWRHLRRVWRAPSFDGAGWGCVGHDAAYSPGADSYLLGAVSVEAVVSTHGAHLLRRATEGLQADGRGGFTPHPQPAKRVWPVAERKRGTHHGEHPALWRCGRALGQGCREKARAEP